MKVATQLSSVEGHRMRLFGLIIPALLACPATVAACDIPSPAIADYLNGHANGRVVFVGNVVASTARKTDGLVIEDLTVSVSKSFGVATLPRTLPVLSRISGGSNPCGRADFSARAGEQWLIFGQRDAERVWPDLYLSRKLVNGRIGAALLRQLSPAASLKMRE
ncbi:hypothetical protein [Massilia pseudoviolaceinigra]|uniref:hypothetical protein n=1 Tax=Massilia pseudoviolaceinigra TaxID=3057165 RepID=UPI002796912D|nr:hypothetical protein [Massilia sp. CCM 9206]MDQ1920634.1 hypothetical protein [Massilia sp. CCM 9206]